MKFIRILILMAISISFVACASYFKRKECEKTNWFSHGEQVALSGGVLEGDKFLNECRAAEANISEGALDQGYKMGRADYCKPGTVFLTGKRGDKFNPNMCDGEPLKILQAKYAQGVGEYCRPSNGIAAGQSGKAYQNVCSADIEEYFLPEFNKGRKKYLQNIILTKEDQIRDIDRSIRGLQQQKYQLLIRLAATPKTVVVGQVEETESSKNARTQLESEMNSVDWQISQKRRDQETIRAEIRTIQTEIATL